jgi:hypothetical protein
LLFDEGWYLKTYPDVARANVDPLGHFMSVGWREGRDPGPDFVTTSYLKANPDVARRGVNPLLHYIEYGHAEGREAFGHAPPVRIREEMTFDLPDPVECAAFPLRPASAIVWQRSYRVASATDVLKIDDVVIGRSNNALTIQAIREAFDMLKTLSGDQRNTSPPPRQIASEDERLCDAWYVNSAQLRTRWSGPKLPLVVRAFQIDPDTDAILLIGEGLVASSLDFVDLSLRNPFFPVLFIFGQPDAAVRSARLLAFPSLCRGGVHYPELLALTADPPQPANPDPLTEGERLSRRLLALIGGVDASVSRIEVDLTGADGSKPLFDVHFKQWLQRVVRIDVAPLAIMQGTGPGDFLREGALVHSTVMRDDLGAVLHLNHDMVPTISALSEPRRALHDDSHQQLLPLLIAGAHTQEPVVLVDFPPGPNPRRHGPGQLPISPRLDGRIQIPSSDTFPAGAIQMSRTKPLSDAEILLPTGSDSIRYENRQPIAWLIDPIEWEPLQLCEALECLALQNGAKMDTVAFIGRVGGKIQNAVRGRFARTVPFKTFTEAINGLDTEFTGHIGAGILLHDDQSADLLSALLEDDAVSTASCVLISTEHRGKAWHAALADQIAFHTRAGRRPRASVSRLAAERLWRSTYPVARPPADLWLARTRDLRRWINSSAERIDAGSFHLCSSFVTATREGRASHPSEAPAIPPAHAECVTRMEILFG